MSTLTIARHLRAIAFVLIALVAGPALAAGFTTANGKIYDANGLEIQIRGVSHHGFNAPILQPQYLWEMGWKEQIAQIKALGFNAVRLPFVPDTLYNTTTVDKLSYLNPSKNADLVGKTPLQVLDMWMAEADRVGLYVLMDFHSVSMVRQYPTWYLSNSADFGLMYNKQAYTADNWRRDLVFVAKRYAHLKHFFAIDVYNEPNGDVRWTPANAQLSWKNAVGSASSAILTANPNLLIFAQGITGNFDGVENSNIPMNWGENFQPQAYSPLAVPLNKLVLSPHTYGPDVYMKSSFSAANFPANLAASWDALFGQFANVHAIVPGEWGGHYGNGAGGAKDKQWQDAFVSWMISKGMRNSFYWCYTPNSGDTGGVLDDNLQPRADKMNLLRRLWGSSGSASPPPAPAPTPSPQPAPSGPQPKISGFWPQSGGAGTVVLLTGTNFSGLNTAAITGKSATIKVLSATQLQVTVPSGAASGPIRVYDSSRSVQTAVSFKVDGSAARPPAPAPAPAPTPSPSPTNPQPTISNFSPTSGAVGTVVTINGRGFTGVNQAWAGNAHDARVTVVSDTQVKVTIPSGATSGAIGVLNPAHAAFTPVAFTVR
jgi:aryl-phospho-beta-D-glucosidase BglC (GH1 family)